jgi:hypothetical protein
MDFTGAFRLLVTIRNRPELRSVSKYDVTSSDIMYSNQYTITMDLMGAFRLLATIRTRPELRSVSKYMTSQAKT